MPKEKVRVSVDYIRAKYSHYGDTENLHDNTAVLHIRFLLEEIDRLNESKTS